MRHYNGLSIVARVYTDCCGAYVLSADRRVLLTPNQIVPGEKLTCDGCGKVANAVEEDEAWEE